MQTTLGQFPNCDNTPHIHDLTHVTARMHILVECRIVFLWAAFAVCAAASASIADERPPQIKTAEFRRIKDEFLAKRKVPKNTIISHRDVLPLLKALEAGGMTLNRRELLQMIPGDQSSLVRLLRSPSGRKFIAQTSNNRLMFDRLDRIVNEPGGERLLKDLMKLPDAARYAKMDTAPGVPDLIDFLPKSRSSRTRKVKDYRLPTGTLYTLDDVIGYLEKQISKPSRKRLSK